MTVRRRWIIRLVLLTLVTCLSLSAVLLVIARERAVSLVEDDARDTARLVAHAAEEEPQQVVDLIVAGDDDVVAVAVFDGSFDLLAARSVAGAAVPSAETARALQQQAVLDGTQPVSIDGHLITSVATVAEPSTRYAVVTMDAEQATQIIWREVVLALALTALIATLAGLMAWWTARRLAEPIAELDLAATALERGEYDPSSLASVMGRHDELGRMARRFDTVAREVQAREAALARQVADLQVRIDQRARRERVDEITGSESFAALEERARRMRERRSAVEQRPSDPT